MRVCFLLERQFLDRALRGFTTPKEFYTPIETQSLLEKIRPKLQGDEDFPTRYLFGWAQDTGITKGALQACMEENIEIFLATNLPRKIEFDVLNVQFSELALSQIKNLLKEGVRIAGWFPPEMEDKRVQALFLLSTHIAHHEGSEFLPTQLLLPFRYLATQKELFEWVKAFKKSFLIVKASKGARSKFSSGMSYIVMKSDKLPYLLSRIFEIVRTEDLGIIISELLVTDDPYCEGANNVVHKMDLASDKFTKNIFLAPNQLRIEKIARGELVPLEECISTPPWLSANAQTIQLIYKFVDIFSSLLSKFGLIYSIDFMIPSHGIPKFIEINKDPGTYSDKLDMDCSAVIDEIGKISRIAYESTTDEQLFVVENYLKHLRVIREYLKGPFFISSGTSSLSRQEIVQ